jgi:hypothetical protein
LIHKKPSERKKNQFITTAIEEQYGRVSHHELSNRTSGFSEINLLGIGSFGAVYKCSLCDEDTATAVKVFNILQSGFTRSFVAECFTSSLNE